MGIGSRELKRFEPGLRDQQAIERIAMMVRRITNSGPMHGPNR